MAKRGIKLGSKKTNPKKITRRARKTKHPEILPDDDIYQILGKCVSLDKSFTVFLRDIDAITAANILKDAGVIFEVKADGSYKLTPPVKPPLDISKCEDEDFDEILADEFDECGHMQFPPALRWRLRR